MRLIDKFNQFVYLFIDTLKKFGLFKAWLLLLFWFAVNWFVLYMHYDSLSPMFYGVISVWLSLVKLISNDQAVSAFQYYPQHFFYLGEFFGWAKILLALLFEGLILAAVARQFGKRYNLSDSFGGSVWSRWGHLILVWVVLNALTIGASYAIPPVVAPFINGPRRLAAFSFILMPFVFTFIFSLFIFALPAVAVKGESCFKAIGHSLRLFVKRPFTAFFLAALILFVPLIIGAFAGRPSQIIETFRPEMVYWLLAIGLFVEMIANFFWMGATVRFLSEPEE